MKMSLFAGAMALALTATAAIAQQSYDSTTTRTTVTAPPVAIIPAPAQTTTVQRTVTAPVAPAASSYREEHVTTQDGQVVEHTTRSDTASPEGRTTTYTQTTTSDGQ